MRERKKKRSS